MDALEEGYIVSVAIDVSAGFDTVPQSYLLRKLQMIGYAESTLDWVGRLLPEWKNHKSENRVQ